MKKFNLQKLLRPHLKQLKPYSSARSEFDGQASILLDANENPFNTDYNRYPDPQQRELKKGIAKIKGIPAQNIFIGNGSDEAIDLLLRAFCIPGIDEVIIPTPTYGMYKVSSEINDVKIKQVLLSPSFDLIVDQTMEAVGPNSKIIFLCSPNNPTGNSLSRNDMLKIIENFNGLVVVDEAYIDFSGEESFSTYIHKYGNLVVLQTLSKAWGLAGIRLGLGFAQEEIIAILNKIKPPYNISSAAIKIVLHALSENEKVQKTVEITTQQRNILVNELNTLSFVRAVYPSQTNFLLVKVTDPKKYYNLLKSNGIIVRDRSHEPLCEGCLRITVGTQEENLKLAELLKISQ